MANKIGSQRIKKVLAIHFPLWTEQNLPLSNATFKSCGDDTDFAHWRFTSEDNVAGLWFRTTISAVKVLFMRITRITKIEASVTDVLITNYNEARGRPIRREVGTVHHQFTHIFQ